MGWVSGGGQGDPDSKGGFLAGDLANFVGVEGEGENIKESEVAFRCFYFHLKYYAIFGTFLYINLQANYVFLTISDAIT